MAINITQQLNLVNPAGDIDSFYGPYANIGTATSTIPAALLTANSVGRKIGIITSSGKIVDYTWQLTGTNQYGFVSDYDTLDTKIDNLISSIQTSVATATTAASSAATSAANAQTAANTASTDVANLASNAKANAWMKEWAAAEYTKVKADYDYVYNQYTTTEKSSSASGWTTYNTAYNNYIGDATNPGIILSLKNSTTNTSINNTTLDTYRSAYYSAYTTVLRYLGSKVTTNTSDIASHTTSIGNFQTLYNLTNPLVAVANENSSASVPVNGLESGNSLLLQSAGLKGAILEDTLGILNKSQVVEAGLNGRKEDLLLWAGSTYAQASSGAYKDYYKTNHSGAKVPLLLKKNGDGKIGPIEFKTSSGVSTADIDGKLNIGEVSIDTEDRYLVSNLLKVDPEKSYHEADYETNTPARASLLLEENGTGNFGCFSIDGNLNASIYNSPVTASSNLNLGPTYRTKFDGNNGSLSFSVNQNTSSLPLYEQKILLTSNNIFNGSTLNQTLGFKETTETLIRTQNGAWGFTDTTDTVATYTLTSDNDVIKTEDYLNLKVNVPTFTLTASIPSSSDINTNNNKITKNLICQVTYYKNTSTLELIGEPELFVIYLSSSAFEYNLNFTAASFNVVPRYRNGKIKIEVLAYYTIDTIKYAFENTTILNGLSTTTTLTKGGISSVSYTDKPYLTFNSRTTIPNNAIIIGADGILAYSDSDKYTFIKNTGDIIFNGLPTSASGLASGTLYANNNILTIVP